MVVLRRTRRLVAFVGREIRPLFSVVPYVCCLVPGASRLCFEVGGLVRSGELALWGLDFVLDEASGH